MNTQALAIVLLALATASYAAPPAGANGTSASPPPAAGASGPSKPEYPKDLGNGVEMINREDCPGGYCETFLIRPAPPGLQPQLGSTPCCPQLPQQPCGGQQQSPCQLQPPPAGCNAPCPQGPPMVG